MQIGTIGNYIIGINAFGFIYFIIYNSFLIRDEATIFDKLLTITAVVGGSLGIFISVLMFDRKLQKSTMMSRVFLVCVLIIQVILYIILTSDRFTKFSFAFWELFLRYEFAVYYLIIVNLLTFILFAYDKFQAIKSRGRIRITSLLGLSLVGGAVGGLLAMYAFRHKTSVDYFSYGLPLIIVMQIVVMLFINNLI